MKKKYSFRTVNIPSDWFERFKAICAHTNRTPGMQLREAILLMEKHYKLKPPFSKSNTKQNTTDHE